MNHKDHVFLLQNGITSGIWADLGSGAGAFTLALADLLGPGSTIYSVDQDANALRQQIQAMRQFSQVMVHYQTADFTTPLTFPPLDGIVMANSLHFVRQKETVLRQVKGYLKENGRFLLVEYNADQGNPWVPYPLSYSTWEKLARQVGFQHTHLLATYPSRFLGQIFSAVSW